MDPIGAGVVSSLSRPGGNVTGMSIQQTDTAGKRIELLREVVPKLARLAVMANAEAAGAVVEMREVVATAKFLGLEVTPIEIRQADKVFRAVDIAYQRHRCPLCRVRPVDLQQPRPLNVLAKTARLPTIYGSREYTDAGALMSYGPNWPDLFRHAAEQVNKILHGAKPADIPVEQPTKFDLVINLGTAKALGLDVPPTLLARADEVIE